MVAVDDRQHRRQEIRRDRGDDAEAQAAGEQASTAAAHRVPSGRRPSSRIVSPRRATSWPASVKGDAARAGADELRAEGEFHLADLWDKAAASRRISAAALPKMAMAHERPEITELPQVIMAIRYSYPTRPQCAGPASRPGSDVVDRLVGVRAAPPFGPLPMALRGRSSTKNTRFGCLKRASRPSSASSTAASSRRTAGRPDHDRRHPLAEIRMRHADDGALDDAGDLVDLGLDLLRVDVEPPEMTRSCRARRSGRSRRGRSGRCRR